MKTNFAVIIQGPIFSYGSGGKNDNPEGFNSVETIKENLKIIENYIPLKNVIFSGWDSDIKIDKLKITQHRSKDLFTLDYLNQKRQFYTIKEGFTALSNNKEIDYFIKIRTDQLFPHSFWKWLIEKDQDLNKKILVSEFYNNSPYAIGDFVISSSKSNFLNFIKSQSFKRRSINGSRNMALKHLVFKSHNLATDFSNNFFINDIKFVLKSDYIFDEWSKSFKDEFFTIPLDIFKQILWRGVSMEERFDDIDQIFSFDKTTYEKHTFKYFKADYNRYWSFIKTYFKKKLKKVLKK